MASDIRQACERLKLEVGRLRAERDKLQKGTVERERISGEILGVVRAMKVISVR